MRRKLFEKCYNFVLVLLVLLERGCQFYPSKRLAREGVSEFQSKRFLVPALC
jgi:hypothetical protein